ncbi:MAG: LegC family aminotransferase [Oscillospiraceae bacterium]
MQFKIPLSVPNLRGRELEYLTECVDGEWVSTGGPYITEFEEKLAGVVGAADAVACQSGTAGLHLAMLQLGVLPGDEVLVPTLTFIASANPVRYCGAQPVFMDCDDSLCLDPIKLRSFCEEQCEVRDGQLFNKSSGRRIAALEVVHVFGNMADMESIVDIAEEFGLPLLEDACEALCTKFDSGRYDGRYAGTIGDIGVFSFNGNKIMTTGGGGMIVAKDVTALAHMRFLSTQAKTDPVRFVHDEIGYNYRLTNMQAALGVAQLEQMPEFLATKKRNYELYQREGIPLLPFRKGISPNYWFYSYMTETAKNRDELMASLGDRGIQTRPIWALMHTLKPYAGNEAYSIERASYYFDHVLNLPCSTNLSTEEVSEVANAIKELVK